MTSQILISTGAIILGILGIVHFVYVVATPKFFAHDPKVTHGMQRTSPNISKDTTMWSAWVGFNLSHSLGVLLLPMIYLPLAWYHPEVLKISFWLAVLPACVSLGYAYLAKKYWFSVPMIGSLLAFICFLSAVLLMP